MPKTYFQHIADGIRTTLKGMGLTWRHLWAARRRRRVVDVRSDDFFGQSEGMVTIQYPLETIPIPDHGRYRLHNEMDDCIVCDKCAKICPVDCIEIEPIRATGEVGKASDGSPIRLYAARFDIDMAKCCYCGLCTTVCPTECLTMTKTFDYSELDVRDMIYEFGNLTPAEAGEKKQLLAQFQAEKEALKAAAQAMPKEAEPAGEPTPRPAFKPMMKPKTAPPIEQESAMKADHTAVEEPKVPFRPTQRPVMPTKPQAREEPASKQEGADGEKKKVPFRPTMKPPESAAPHTGSEDRKGVPPEEKPKPKVPFRPTMKPAGTAGNTGEPEGESGMSSEKKPKPPFRPTMKPPKPKEE